MAGEEKEDWSSPDSGNQDLREEGFKNDEEAYRDERWEQKKKGEGANPTDFNLIFKKNPPWNNSLKIN